MAAPKNVKVHYFQAPGRVEPVRLLLTLQGVKFEDIRYTQEEWAAKKAAFAAPLPQMEYERDGQIVRLGQSMAMTNFAARCGPRELVPRDPLELARANVLAYNLEDWFFTPLVRTFRVPEDEQPAARAAMCAEGGAWTKAFTALDRHLGEAGEWAAGGKNMTFADIVIFSLQAWNCANPKFVGIPANCTHKYKNLMAHKERVARDPAIAEYYKDAEWPFAVFKPEGDAPPSAGPCTLSTAPPTKLTLVYFGIPARGEVVRLTCGLRGVHFEDRKIKGADLGALKAKLGDLTQVPLLFLDGDEDGRCINQSYAQARYVASLPGDKDAPQLLPQDAESQGRIEEVIRDIDDNFLAHIGRTFTDVPEGKQRTAAREKLVAPDGSITAGMKALDTKLGKSKSGWIVGDSMTLADIAVYTLVFGLLGAGFLDGLPTSVAEPYANIVAHKAKMLSVPRVAAFYERAQGTWAYLKA